MDNFEYNGMVTINTERCDRCKDHQKYSESFFVISNMTFHNETVDMLKLIVDISNFMRDKIEENLHLPCTCDMKRYKGLTVDQLRFLKRFDTIDKDFLNCLLGAFRVLPNVRPAIVYEALRKKNHRPVRP